MAGLRLALHRGGGIDLSSVCLFALGGLDESDVGIDGPLVVVLRLAGIMNTGLVLAYFVGSFPHPEVKSSVAANAGISIVGCGDVVLHRIVPALTDLGSIARLADNSEIFVVSKDVVTEPRPLSASIRISVAQASGITAIDEIWRRRLPCIVAVPTSTHMYYVDSLLSKRITVAVEKPICGPDVDVDIVRRIVAGNGAGANGLFCLSYYLLEKALPLTAVLLSVGRRNCRRDSDVRDDVEAAFQHLRRYVVVSCEANDTSGDGCLLDTMGAILGQLVAFGMWIHETEERSPSGVTRHWTETSDGDGAGNGGTLYETFIHCSVLDRLAVVAAGSLGGGAGVLLRAGRSRYRFDKLAAARIASGVGLNSDDDWFEPTWIRYYTKEPGLHRILSAKKFANVHRRCALAVFQSSAGTGYVRANFDDCTCDVFLPNGIKAHICLAAGHGVSYSTQMLMFQEFSRAGGWTGRRWDLAKFQVLALEDLKRLLPAVRSAAHGIWY